MRPLIDDRRRRLDCGEEVLHAGFAQVLMRAALKHVGDFRFVVLHSGIEQDRHVRMVSFEKLDEYEAVLAGQVDVQNYYVEPDAVRDHQRLRAVASGEDLEAKLFQITRRHEPPIIFVIYE